MVTLNPFTNSIFFKILDKNYFKGEKYGVTLLQRYKYLKLKLKAEMIKSICLSLVREMWIIFSQLIWTVLWKGTRQ